MAPRDSRIQARTDALEPERFRPAASPAGSAVTPQARLIDTFVQPASTLDRNAGSKLMQLSNALQGLAPTLARVAGSVQQHGNEKDYNNGVALAQQLQKEGIAYKQAIDSGRIDPHQSKFYVAGVREQMGAAMAGKFDDFLADKLERSEDLKASTDPVQFDKFVAQARSEWEAANIGDPGNTPDEQHFTLGYNARAQQHIDARRSEFIAQTGQKLKTQSIGAHFAETLKTATDEAGKVDGDTLAAAFNQKNDDLIAQGRDATLVYNTTTRAITQAALRALQDPATRDRAKPILDLLTKIKGTDGVALSDSNDEGRASYLNTLSTIVDQRNKLTIADRQTQKLAEEKRVDDTYAAAIKFAYANPNASLQPFVDQVSDIRGAADEINKIRGTVHDTTQNDNQTVVDGIWADIWLDSSKVSSRRIVKERNAGNLTLETATRLQSQFEQKQALERQTDAAERTASSAARREYRDLVSDPLFTRVLSEQQKQFTSATGIVAGASADASKMASAMLQKSWIEWRSGKGADATPVEMTDWLEQNSTAIVKMNRQGLIGFDKNGEPQVKPQKPKADAAKVPELSTSDIEVLRKISKGEQAQIPDALQARLNGLGSNEAVQKYIKEQLALHKPVQPKTPKPTFKADTTGIPAVTRDSTSLNLEEMVKQAVAHDYPLEYVLRQVQPDQRTQAMHEFYKQHKP